MNSMGSHVTPVNEEREFGHDEASDSFFARTRSTVNNAYRPPRISFPEVPHDTDRQSVG